MDLCDFDLKINKISPVAQSFDSQCERISLLHEMAMLRNIELRENYAGIRRRQKKPNQWPFFRFRRVF